MAAKVAVNNKGRISHDGTRIKNFVALTPTKLEATLVPTTKNGLATFVCLSGFYLSGTYIEDLDAPIPGEPCLTGLLVIENSPK